MNTTRQPVYSLYQRIWHWLQAAAIVTLLLTGLAIHWPGWFAPVDFATAVTIHNLLGFLLLGNAFLGLFYYVTTGTIRQYLPEPHDFVTLAVRHAAYYVFGMFRGEPHPLEKTPGHRLNPLQQVTYLAILNVLLPLQLVSGLLMWAAQRVPDAVASVGGLGTLAMIHTLGAWLFAAFAIMHVYLTTTGATPLAHLKTMLLGYEEDSHASPPVDGDACASLSEPREVKEAG